MKTEQCMWASKYESGNVMNGSLCLSIWKRSEMKKDSEMNKRNDKNGSGVEGNGDGLICAYLKSGKRKKSKMKKKEKKRKKEKYFCVYDDFCYDRESEKREKDSVKEWLKEGRC